MINERITAYIDKQGMIILTSMMHNKLNGYNENFCTMSFLQNLDMVIPMPM